MVAMAIMVASFRQSLDDWLAVMLPADVYVRAAGGDSVRFHARTTSARSRGSACRARRVPARDKSLWLDPALPRVALLARESTPAMQRRALPLVGDALRVTAGAPPPAWISEACGRC